jgi:hypothetical protein
LKEIAKEPLKTFTMADIRNWKPCYDLSRYLPENWSGTVIDLLKIDAIPAQVRLSIVCREELIDAKILRLFAVWCARQVQHLMTDERSLKSLEIAEAYALGRVSKQELSLAEDDAWNVNNAATWPAAKAAAWAAALDVAKAAAYTANRAASAAGTSDRSITWDAANAAAGAAQVAQFIKIIEDANENT